MGLGWWHRVFGVWAVWIYGDGGGFSTWNGPWCGTGTAAETCWCIGMVGVDLWLCMGAVEPQCMVVQFFFHIAVQCRRWAACNGGRDAIGSLEVGAFVEWDQRILWVLFIASLCDFLH